MEKAIFEKLVSDVDGLLLLEKEISSFNIFEATGAVRRELRHSDFIGFLFDPSETHGFGDAFYLIFCREMDVAVENTPIINVLREWEHIDILVRDRANKIIIAIENKIDTTEHSDQLQRYRKIIDSAYPDYDRRYFYLTKTGEQPTDKGWKAVSYTDMRVCLQELAVLPSISADVKTLMQHYQKMIERHFMPDNKIAELCRKVYSEHRRAIDLIIEHRPEGGEDVFDKIRELIQKHSQFELDHGDIHRIRFAVPIWDNIPDMRSSTWTRSKRFVLFEVKNNVDGNERVQLKLFLGPTISPIRERLFEYVQSTKNTFNHIRRELTGKWAQIYSFELLGTDDVNQDDKLKILENNWNHFLQNDFPIINQSIVDFIKTSSSYIPT